MNLFAMQLMTEADEDPPAVDTAAPAAEESPPADAGGPPGDDGSPPDIGDLSSPSMDDGVGDYQDDGQTDDAGGGREESEDDPNNLPLDEKGEIFAKVKIFSSFRYLYKRIDDTLSTIDKIDIVQISNSIKADDVTELKQKFSALMDDVYTTIVYEFQQQYSNLKVKLVEYSSRYVLLTKSLVSLIKKDQAH